MDSIETVITERECFEKLLDIIYPEGFSCPSCRGKDRWLKPERRIVICRRCRKEVSPLSKTMFGRSHLSLQNWFEIIRLMTCSPERVITAKIIFTELNLGSYRTAWSAMNKIRFAITKNEPRIKLEGLIEFDELVISGIGSEYRKLSILGALELEGGRRLSLQMVKNPDEMNIKVYLRKRFGRGVTVITNPEKLYIRNWLELNRYKNKSAVEHYGKNFMNLHIILQDIRYGLRNGHHSVSEKYLQRNLDEFVFVFNHNAERERAREKLLNYMIDTKIEEYRSSEQKKTNILSILSRG